MISLVRDHADKVDIAATRATDLGVPGEDISAFVDEANDARAAADSAERDAVRMDDEAIAINDAAYALEVC